MSFSAWVVRMMMMVMVAVVVVAVVPDCVWQTGRPMSAVAQWLALVRAVHRLSSAVAVHTSPTCNTDYLRLYIINYL